jgi:hypothetical protein
LDTNPGGLSLGPKDVAGTVPGEVYYADQPGLHPRVYWAVAAFQPSAAISSATANGQTDLAQFQNSDYIFDWTAGPYWNELGSVPTGSCPGSYVPTSVLAAWGLCGQ